MSAVATVAVAPTPIKESTINGLPKGWLSDPLEALNREHGPFTAVTAEQFLDTESVELYNGWLVPQEMTDTIERKILSTIQTMLDISARKASFGQALMDQAECLLNNGTVIKPDSSLISWKRLSRDVIPYGPNYRPTLIGCPELVIESRSPSNRRRQEAVKRALYFAHGTEIVWDVDEANQVIYVYRAEAPEQPTRFGIDDIIDCKLLPGWQRRVADIFAAEPSAEAIAGEVAEEWIEEGKELGREEGANQRSIEMARAMLADGLEPATVAKYSGLSVAQVTALQAA